MKWYLLFSLYFIFSCSSVKKDSLQSLDDSWIKNEKCMQANNICALGYGKDQISADLKAKKELASFFKSKISSDLNSSTLSKQTLDSESLTERTSIEINEKVDDYLESVYIEKRAVKSNIYYALAKVNRSNLNARLQQRYSKIARKMRKVSEYPYRSSLYNLELLLDEKEEIDRVYSAINSTQKQSLSEESNLQDFKNKLEKKRVYIKLSQNSESFNLRPISEKLRKVGHVIVNDKNLAQVEILVNLKMKDSYLNVSGFDKFLLNISIESKHRDGTTQGEIQVNSQVTGRSLSDAMSKAYQLIESQVSQKFYLLKI